MSIDVLAPLHLQDISIYAINSVWLLLSIFRVDVSHLCETNVREPYYRKTSNIRRTKSQSSNVSRLVLQLYMLNPLKLGVKWRMKM